MKRMILPLIGIVLSLGATAQNTEFKQSESGLIYSDTTIKQLKFIVDSLNLKFRVCELSKDYYSFSQTKTHSLSIDKKYYEKAMMDMNRDISLSDFEQKYNPTVVTDLVVIRYEYTNDKNEKILSFHSVDLGKVGGFTLNFSDRIDQYKKPLKGKWVYSFYESNDYASLSILYIVEEFEKIKLPEKYARMIQYADCMVDTNTQIFYEEAKNTGRNFINNDGKHLKAFLKYTHLKTNMPEYSDNMSDEDWELYHKRYRTWDSLRFIRVDSLRSVDHEFTKLFNRAMEEVFKNGSAGDEFEEYVARYYSTKKALELKRNRIVVGGCSMDNSPRIHALNIAVLSAETISWEVFLRAHLDIMNDRFDRASDGSYAWAARKTYIKELEVLDINVHDLIFGISLRIDNPSKNHYFGSIGRLGRALSETEHKDEIENQMLEMIGDNSLDNYNRILIYYLYLNYVHHIEDKKLKEKKTILLNAKVKEMPLYIASRLLKE